MRATKLHIHLEGSTEVTGDSIVENVTVINATLKNECQELVKDVPVKAGEFPIHVGREERPSYEFLESLYKLFLKFNNKKLSTQYQISKGYCHLRVHLVNIMLCCYGINTVKVFKVWNPSDWEKLKERPSQQSSPASEQGTNIACDFHCGTMIIDSNNNKWVWEPWVGENKKLLTLAEWVYEKDTPKPISLCITNRSVLSNHENDLISSSSYDYSFLTLYRNVFQQLISSAIPNPPRRDITFFATYPASSSNDEICEEKSRLNKQALISYPSRR
jgi:hypothetical protein